MLHFTFSFLINLKKMSIILCVCYHYGLVRVDLRGKKNESSCETSITAPVDHVVVYHSNLLQQTISFVSLPLVEPT